MDVTLILVWNGNNIFKHFLTIFCPGFLCLLLNNLYVLNKHNSLKQNIDHLSVTLNNQLTLG